MTIHTTKQQIQDLDKLLAGHLEKSPLDAVYEALAIYGADHVLERLRNQPTAFGLDAPLTAQKFDLIATAISQYATAMEKLDEHLAERERNSSERPPRKHPVFQVSGRECSFDIAGGTYWHEDRPNMKLPLEVYRFGPQNRTERLQFRTRRRSDGRVR